jgi:hypothetical protein
VTPSGTVHEVLPVNVCEPGVNGGAPEPLRILNPPNPNVLPEPAPKVVDIGILFSSL